MSKVTEERSSVPDAIPCTDWHADPEPVKPEDQILHVKDLCEKLESLNELNKDTVESVLKRYKGTDYKNWVKTDCEGRYHRGAVCTGTDGRFCVLVMTWNPANGSAIHSHGASECSLLMLDGDLEERIYSSVQGPIDLVNENSTATGIAIDLNVTERGASKPGSIGYVNDHIGPHSIWNTNSEKHAVSLHVYYPAYETCYVFCDKTGAGKICLLKECAEKAPTKNTNDLTTVAGETATHHDHVSVGTLGYSCGDFIPEKSVSPEKKQ